jgi:hypothetical protein
MIDILNRYTQSVLFHSETAQSIAEAVIESKQGGANLRGADLRGANLREADLSDADLREADLSEADLRVADLSEANLSEADLSWANLSEANLRGADLRGADLSGANLRGADLSDADLRGADLSDAKQYILRIQGSRHEINAIDDDVRIGCERHILEWWLEHYRAVGHDENYTAIEISEYGAHLKHIAAVLEARKPKAEVA